MNYLNNQAPVSVRSLKLSNDEPVHCLNRGPLVTTGSVSNPKPN